MSERRLLLPASAAVKAVQAGADPLLTLSYVVWPGDAMKPAGL